MEDEFLHDPFVFGEEMGIIGIKTSSIKFYRLPVTLNQSLRPEGNRLVFSRINLYKQNHTLESTAVKCGTSTSGSEGKANFIKT